MHKNILSVVGIIILFLGSYITPSVAIDTIRQSSMPTYNGNTLYVGGSGPGNYTWIQDAIDAANSSDTMFVYDDSSPYYENLIVYKSINLVGENRDTTTINGGGGDVFDIYVDWVNISGFTIQNWGDIWDCKGIYISSNYNTITGNTIMYSNRGISIEYSSNYNTLTGNTIMDTKHGIYLSSSNNNTIFKNNFLGNKRHAFFEDSWNNTWKQNYWGRPRILPKLIFGVIKINSRWILRVNIDWHPALIPYDI